MNLLELTQAVAFKSRTVPGSGNPAVLTGLTGRLARCLDWTQEAWREIQRRRPDWGWMRDEFSGAALENTETYEASDWSLTRFRSWRVNTAPGQDSGWTIYLTSEGVSDERPLMFCPWETFRARFRRGDPETDYPSVFTIDPRNRVLLGPVPDDDYTIKGEYMLGAQALTIAADVPEMPEDFHELIVFQALILLYESDEAAYLDPRARIRVREMMAQLELTALPPVTWAGTAAGGGPLA
jgi:hypothetical protein